MQNEIITPEPSGSRLAGRDDDVSRGLGPHRHRQLDPGSLAGMTLCHTNCVRVHSVT